jgi:hypothetical protein
MPNHPKATADVVAYWKDILVAANEELKRKRAEALRAEEVRDACVRDAFEAGLTVYPVREATGLSVGRIYQINQGVR